MASVGVDFCKFLKANSSIAAKVGRNVYHRHVPQPPPENFLYVGRTGVRRETDLDDTGDPAFSHLYAVECYSTDETLLDDIADAVRGLSGSSGTFGGRQIKWLFVDEQDDDYEAKGIGSDLGWHLAALSAEVVP